MRDNENTVLVGQKVILLPYEVIHVKKYHSWMQSEELQSLTASEPLSMEEEYAMQRSWRDDDDKLTFVIADKEQWDEFKLDEFCKERCSGESKNRVISDESAFLRENSCIIGDVNLFLNDENSTSIAEIEIMIAERSARRGGLATEALKLMMSYGIIHLKLTSYVAKIGCDNVPSLNLFAKKLGFVETSRSDVFSEVTLRRNFGTEKRTPNFVVENSFGLFQFSKLMRNYKEFRTAPSHHSVV